MKKKHLAITAGLCAAFALLNSFAGCRNSFLDTIVGESTDPRGITAFFYQFLGDDYKPYRIYGDIVQGNGEKKNGTITASIEKYCNGATEINAVLAVVGSPIVIQNGAQAAGIWKNPPEFDNNGVLVCEGVYSVFDSAGKLLAAYDVTVSLPNAVQSLASEGASGAIGFPPMSPVAP